MTPQAFGDGHRRALIIGTGTYDHPGLPTLLSPEVDCTRLTEVLRDPEIGQFEVQQLVDTDRSTLERAMGEFFLTAQRDDVCLLYFSCHGVVNRNDKLYFAVRNTDPDRPAYSAISASLVHEVMDECRARSIVAVVDCCYSGLFIPGAKGSVSAGFEDALAGQGRVIITAGTRVQRAWEGDHSDAETPALSRFTETIVDGLRSGDADLNGDGVITVQELFRYASERLHHEGIEQTPRMGGEMQYDIALAKVKKKRRQRSSRTTGKKDPSPRASSPRPRRQPEAPRRVSAASGPARQPVLSDGTLIVHEKYSLHVLDAESRRRYPLIQTHYVGSPAFHGGAAYFPGPGRWLRSVDLRTGRPRRSTRLQVCDGILGVCADTLYAPGPDGSLHSIDLLSGEIRWSQPLGKPAIGCTPEVAAGSVIVMAEEPRPSGDAVNHTGKHIVAVLEATGRPNWSYQPEGQLSPEWVVTDSGIYLVQQIESSHQRIVAVDPTNGEPLWRFDTAADLAAAPAVVGELVIFGDVDNRLVALDAKSGAQLWERRTKGRVLTRPFTVGDTLFTADRAASLTAWKLPIGRKLRSYDVLLSPDHQGSPAVSNGWLYLTDSHGDIHALPTSLR
ncbi:PQQ-binding-like beta-propeller repeat protein [Streptomyces lunaelactis]|uniref:caspase, EACC1-associated type n=1 Tax=Streptomyces lunaelactis TaxID=1535768 RepID=UPI001585CB99|nr:PQQ-binding-like beta-propeller repeat protein [Streptomyces lunaelactis]NUK34094.1 PQQ-binding-like beta-propeller repeat protein [Streptomyces lunaelactis]NUK40805.1 PQQ-binding-like beta-propeller repeat protein [Streptomyces lunaelactis]NUK57845.1 PQQ-binding-like beta-propeller repeat protein [Streptomyces lunaelactis]NUK69414.1 PQQ-binding-like beta-propeller repeat protein [Streptomyces lunaelactis]NUK80938.1 PQQ-binding-like beta-propeller repeat protein [Streptomyces lunaelactis]